MRRVGIGLALGIPPLCLAFWSVYPAADPVVSAPLVHFYVVTFTTFTAGVVSLFIAMSVGGAARPRHLLLAIAFAWMGGVFLLHGAATPGALVHGSHPAVVWSAWLTLLGGGVVMLVAGFAPAAPDPRFVRVVALVGLGLYGLYVAAIVWWPGVLTALGTLTVRPATGDLLFALTVGIWLVGAWRHFGTYRQTRSFVDGLMAGESVWLATATVSMFRFPAWHASWWLYHGLLLVGFLAAVYALWRAYEPLRTFRLTPYFAATSLIVTAGLALGSAHLYGRLVYGTLLGQLTAGAAAASEGLGAGLAAELPGGLTVDDLRRPERRAELARLAERHLTGRRELVAALLYDRDGQVVFRLATEVSVPSTSTTGGDDYGGYGGYAGSAGTGSTGPGPVAAGGGSAPGSDQGWARYGAAAREVAPGPAAPVAGPELGPALAGRTTVTVFPPGATPAGSTSPARVHVLQAASAIGGRDRVPLAILVTAREVPELAEALLGSRRAGLALGGLSLGGLFLSLLVVVRRADRLIANRTRELERAYDDLRRAEGLRDDLTRMIVHDLRTPLASVLGNLELIARTATDPDHAAVEARAMTRAHADGQRMMALIGDLLDVGKLEAGALRPVLTPVGLPPLLAEREAAFRPEIERQGKRLILRVPADLPPVPADAALIGRVVDNLLGNALKYTARGGHLELAVERSGGELRLSVRDDGDGIPPEYLERVFERFVQVTDARGVPLRKGTGLGLTFCRLAVEAHHGRIWVDSTPGRGSTFTFTLPLDRP